MITPRNRGFTHCPRCGAPGLTQPEPSACQCAACGFFYHLNPAVGVGGIVADACGHVILLKRAHDPCKGMLGLPGGFVDAGESAEEALRRELQEEIGLDVHEMAYLGSWPNQYPYRGVLYDVVDLFFACRTKTFATATAKSETTGLCIFEPETIPLDQIAFPSVRQAIETFCLRLED